jgi:hypothetical protein
MPGHGGVGDNANKAYPLCLKPPCVPGPRVTRARWSPLVIGASPFPNVGRCPHDDSVDPDAPYWLLISGGAVGGAMLTTLANFALKAVDLRHRHDEARREHYVAMHLSIDNLHQAVLDAVTANNRRTFDGDPEPAPGVAGAAWIRAQTTTAEAQDKYNEAMRAYRLLSLFAPARVMEPLNDALIPMAAVFVRLHHVATADPGRLPVPEYPHEAVHRFTNAVRKDLGMRNLPLFDNPASSGWGIESDSLGHALIAQQAVTDR